MNIAASFATLIYSIITVKVKSQDSRHLLRLSSLIKEPVSSHKNQFLIHMKDNQINRNPNRWSEITLSVA